MVELSRDLIEILDFYSGDLKRYTIEKLRELGLRPSKKRGQNFTISIRILEDVTSAVSRLGCGNVIEVGSGLGVLTLQLNSVCRKIYSIEIDKRLCRYLEELFRSRDNIEFICGDALEYIDKLDAEGLFATPPYSITGPLLGKLASSRIKWAVMILQRDVVERLAAKPGEENYGSVTVLVRTYFDLEIGRVYKPHLFYPRPEVDSRLVILKRYRDKLCFHEELEKSLKCMFSQRNKLVYKVARECLSIELSEKIYREKRVDEIPPEDFLRILSTIYSCSENIPRSL